MMFCSIGYDIYPLSFKNIKCRACAFFRVRKTNVKLQLVLPQFPTEATHMLVFQKVTCFICCKII